jgi:hypothetical protein
MVEGRLLPLVVGGQRGLECLVVEHVGGRGPVDGLGADVGLLAGLGDRVRDDVRDPLLGRAGRERELVVVARAPVRVRQDPARVVDEAQRFLDVSLPVARLRVVLADEPAQRRAHLLVGGGLRYAQRLVKRGLHARVSESR